MGGHWYASPTFRCQIVTQVPIQAVTNSQRGSLPGLVLIDERYVGLYIGLRPKYVMVLGSEVIFTT